MTWRDQTLFRILMFAAKLISDPKWHSDLNSLGSHVSVHAKEAEKV